MKNVINYFTGMLEHLNAVCPVGPATIEGIKWIESRILRCSSVYNQIFQLNEQIRQIRLKHAKEIAELQKQIIAVQNACFHIYQPNGVCRICEHQKDTTTPGYDG
jgi:hypothetical protein